MALPSILTATHPLSLPLNFPRLSISLGILAVIVLAAGILSTTVASTKQLKSPKSLKTFARFFYASFLKPHNGDGAATGQQAALESFYKAQVVSPFATSSHT